MKKEWFFLSLCLILVGCASQDISVVDQYGEDVEKSTIQWYEPQTEKEEFFLYALGCGSNGFVYDMKIKEDIKTICLKFYQYIDGKWISHYKSELDIQQYTKPIEISVLGTYDSQIMLGITNQNFTSTYHHIDIEKNKKDVGVNYVWQTDEIGTAELNVTKETPVFAYLCYPEGKEIRPKLDDFYDPDAVKNTLGEDEDYWIWTVSFE